MQKNNNTNPNTKKFLNENMVLPPLGVDQNNAFVLYKNNLLYLNIYYMENLYIIKKVFLIL